MLTSNMLSVAYKHSWTQACLFDMRVLFPQSSHAIAPYLIP
jgi:hypothetical protein